MLLSYKLVQKETWLQAILGQVVRTCFEEFKRDDEHKAVSLKQDAKIVLVMITL